ECREQRRKCIRTSIETDCERCRRLGKLCRSSRDLEIAQLILTNLRSQIQQLERSIEHVEKEMYSKHLVPSTMTSAVMAHSLSNQWKFHIHNGHISIETGIQSISDLLPLQTSISYLSPFSADWGFNSDCSSQSSASSSSSDSSIYLGGDSGLLLKFRADDTSNWIPFNVELLTRLIEFDQNDILIPRKLVFDPRPMVCELVDIFFQCHSIYRTLVHESSYRSRLLFIQDPLSDPITLGICCFVCTTPCLHVRYSLQDQRKMADFFFTRSKSIIMNQFDLYEKRLENVISIGLLVQYMHTTLRFSDCRNLLDLAFDICLDLQKDYTDESSIFQKQLTSPVSLQPLTESVNTAMFTRHIFYIVYFRRMINFIEKDRFFEVCFHLPPLVYTADESEETKRFVKSQNWILMMLNHPFMTSLMKQIHLVHFGQICTLSFDSIVKLDKVIDEWVAAIPDEFRLCSDYNNIDMCKAAIDMTTDAFVLCSFGDFCMLQLSIYTTLLKPIPVNAEGEQVFTFVMQHSFQKSIQACALLVHTVKRL
ncbi:uncharacterized protein B0P05DRAFT_448478, partial [Gilbertella persicaria]|uniref:uncharacterized protein n=1 Tax=Gilbertella persicaria TaxID=101096 RepID=UPI00221E981C